MIDSRPLEDPGEAREYQQQARHTNLKWIMLGIMGLMLVLMVVELLVAPVGDSRAGLAAAMSVVSFLAYGLIRLGKAQVMNVPLVLSVLVFGAWAMYGYGSVRASSSLSMMAAVVLAGAFLSRNMVIFTTLSAILILAGLTWAENQGLLVTPSFQADLRFWSLACVILFVMGGLLFYTRRATDEAHVRRLNHLEDRHRLEGERDVYLRRFGRVFQLNPSALMIQSVTSKIILDANPAFERRFGYPLEQMLGRQPDFLWTDAKQWQAHRAASLSNGLGEWAKVRGVDAQGETFEVWVSCVLSDGQSGALVLTTLVDPQPQE